MNLVIDRTFSEELAEMHPALVRDYHGRMEARCSDDRLWVVVDKKGAEIHRDPTWMVKAHDSVGYGALVACLERQGAWMRIADQNSRELGWVMWKHALKREWRLKVKPLGLVAVESRWVDDGEQKPLPGEALDWVLSEVDMFLATRGETGPSRETAIRRSGKPLSRGVRFEPYPIEYRVGGDDDSDTGGMFALAGVRAGETIEVCPLLRITEAARRLSEVLGRYAISMPADGDKERTALPLGFARLYAKSTGANCRWDFRGDEEIVIWAYCDVFIGQELFLELDGPPVAPPQLALHDSIGHADRKAEIKKSMPQLFHSGKLTTCGFVTHGNSSAHGRGVFAQRDFQAGDLIESCPAVLLDEVGAKALVSYRWAVADKTSFDSRPQFFLPLGLGGLYNHFEPPHVRGRLDTKRHVLEFFADKEIQNGQEVFVTYGDDYFDDDFAALGHSRAGIVAPELPS